MTNSCSVEMVEGLQVKCAGDGFMEWPGEEAAGLDVLIAMGPIRVIRITGVSAPW